MGAGEKGAPFTPSNELPLAAAPMDLLFLYIEAKVVVSLISVLRENISWMGIYVCKSGNTWTLALHQTLLKICVNTD